MALETSNNSDFIEETPDTFGSEIREHMFNPDVPPKQPPMNLKAYVLANCKKLNSFEKDENGITRMKNPITDNYIDERMKWFKMENKLDKKWGEQIYICPTVIAWSPYGNDLEPEGIENMNYLCELFVEPDAEGKPSGRVAWGYGFKPNYIYNLIPDEIKRSCTMFTGAFRKAKSLIEFGGYDVSPENRQWLFSEYHRVWTTLQELFQKVIDEYNNSLN